MAEMQNKTHARHHTSKACREVLQGLDLVCEKEQPKPMQLLTDLASM